MSRTAKIFFGILTRRERWGLSWSGWMIAIIVTVSAAGLLMLTIHPFLAVTERLDSNVLVVEGWVHEYAILASVEEFKAGHYTRVYVTGGPVTGSSGYTADQDTAASVGAGLLRKAGVSGESVQMVPSHVAGLDRTYSSAVALREWFQERKIPVSSINVVTEGVHSRRTRLLFQKAFGNNVLVGVIAVINPDYDSKHWWRYSEGVREVIGEGIAYTYARLFFHPTPQ